MKSDFRFAVIGTGKIVDQFLDALSQVEGAEAVAVYSRRTETGAAFASRHGIPRVYTEEERMLADPSIDGVYIASPHFCHKEQAIRALSAGKHVLVEKSAALCAADLCEMRACAKREGRVLLEAMRPDFDPAYQVLREALPTLGRIRRASFVYCQYSSRYDAFRRGEVLNAFDPAIGNSALLDIGVYPLHVCLGLFGRPRSLGAHSVYLENGFEAAGEIYLDYRDRGFSATVSYSKIQNGASPSVIEGEEGALCIDRITTPREILLLPRGKEPISLPFLHIENNMRFEIEHFLAMTRGDETAEPYLSVTELTLSSMDRAASLSHA